MPGQNAHVIVLGNEKGGSGKSTTAFHLGIYLLYQGFNVASIDCDSRQQTLTHYVTNRANWARERGLDVPHTTHYHLPLSRTDSIRENDRMEFELFRQAISMVERDADFLVIDTPGFDTHLTRLSHSLADTLITPINDSLIDLDVLARIDPVTHETGELSHYSRLVLRARKERATIDGRSIDWVIVRNRISMLSSRNMRAVQSSIEQIAVRLGCRMAEGIAERVIFRSLFPLGLTVFDPPDEARVGGVSTVSHVSARREYKQLVTALNLPTRSRTEQRKKARAEWAAHSSGTHEFKHLAPSS